MAAVSRLTYAAVLDRLAAAGSVKPGLERTEVLLEALAHPEAGMRGVLVAGTNGKGSVCAIVESVCRAAGLRTTMLTNPHLRSYCERIAVDGIPLSEDAFADVVEAVLSAVPGGRSPEQTPTQFEILTAAGLLAAARADSDVLVCEVGLGGRLDSTNVLDLGVSVITNVSLEHEALLGSTVERIAAEKAAIIKPGNDVVTAAHGGALAAIRARAAAVGAGITALGADVAIRGRSLGMAGIEVSLSPGAGHAWRLPLRGEHQVVNAATALAACLAMARRGLPLGHEAMARGAATVRWPGRMEWREGQPCLLLDGAHNPAGMEAMTAAAAELCSGRRVVGLFGAMVDKKAAAMLAALRKLTDLAVFTRVSDARARDPFELASAWSEGGHPIAEPAEALATARRLAGPDGVVVVCGSLYLVAEILACLDGPTPVAVPPGARSKPSPGRRPAWP
ncbi:MAG: folylpolyglutamate synthase/dihydrofolate synthase family protein [Candidatus Dormibacteria bacterium]